MRTDLAELKRNTDIVAVIQRYGIELKKDGRNFVSSCPFHSERSASFKVTEGKKGGFYKCFGCGAQGDVFDFLVNYAGRTLKEAIAEIQDPNNTAAIAPGTYSQPETLHKTEWRAIEPRSPFKDPDVVHYKLGRPTKIWYYRNANGHPVGLVCRFDLPGGKKEVMPFCFCTDDKGREEWRWKGLEKPRPLYNLHHLKIRATEPVMIGEGEKTADAMHNLFHGYTATTWIGGVEGVKYTDFSPLYGREILLWPDNDKEKVYKQGPRKGQVMDFHDQPGNKAMLMIAAILKEYCPVIRWVKNADDLPCGWDVADASWIPEEAVAYLDSHVTDVPAAGEQPPQQEAPVVSLEVVHNDHQDAPPTSDSPVTPQPPKDPGIRGGGYFRFLGYEKEINVNLYHFYSYSSKSVISLSPSAMTRPNLLQLAPLRWWEQHYPRPKGGFELDEAQDWLIQQSVKEGVFNSRWIRGRGAWIDGNDVVVHVGKQLIVNGQPRAFENYDSRYIYEIGEDMGFPQVAPLTSKESSFLIELLKLLNWERDADAYLLAGWCVVAPICGALTWRPHIWLTGPSGSGKSWVFEKIVRHLLGGSALAVQGETSEAGVRQTLKHDALPVVFDEAEGEDRKSQERMADVLGLVRSASHSDSGIIAKGSSGGTANAYRMRSCFAFASIAIQVQHQSDRTRVTIVSLRKPKETEDVKQRWADLQKKYLSKITSDFSDRLRARTITNLPVILKNAATFSAAAAAELGQQRTGDQVGVLLAGAFSLVSHKEISYNKAIEWIRQKDWSEERSHEQTRDELALIQYLLSQITRIESPSGVQERTIGELVRTAAGIHSDRIFDMQVANDRLSRLGIKVESVWLIIGNSQPAINSYLAGTHWAKNYNKILMRLEQATAINSTTFASGIKGRAVKVPINTLFNAEQTTIFNPPIVTGNPDDDLPF